MSEANNLPQSISHKKLNLLMLKAKKDHLSISESHNSEVQEIDELLNDLDSLEIIAKKVIKKISSKNDKILSTKSSNSIMALGAMEVHLNMAIQALNIFKNDKN